MANAPSEPIPLQLSYRSYVSCAVFSAFVAVHLVLLVLDIPTWIRVYAAVAAAYVATQVVAFFLYGKRWVLTADELVAPTIWNPGRRLPVPETGIGIQYLPYGLMVYLGDPTVRTTPRFAPNLCMSTTDIAQWLPHHPVGSGKRLRDRLEN